MSAAVSEARRQALPKPGPTRPTQSVRTTFHTDPSRPLPPSKIGPRKRKINLAELLRPDPTLPASLVAPPPPPQVDLPWGLPPTEPARTKPTSTASLKHRLRAKSAAEIYTAAEAKRTAFNRKYINHCRRFNIPYPVVGVRETEHLNACHLCQKTWPLFLYEQHYVCKHPIEDVTRAWCDLPEFERMRLHQMLSQADRQWLKNAIKSRSASSFQLFAKDLLESNEEIKALKDIRVRSARLSALWKAQPPEVRHSYDQRAEQAKTERLNQLANLPAFKKKQVDRARREYRRVLRESHPPKPPNPYLLYQKDAWQHEVQKPHHLAYRDFVKLSSQRWKTELTEEEKKPFVEAAQVCRANYFVRRDAASARLKAVKQQKREANRALQLAKKRRKTQVHPDQGSDDERPEFPGPTILPAGDLTFPRSQPSRPARQPSLPVPESPAPSTPLARPLDEDETHDPDESLDDDEEDDDELDLEGEDDDDEAAEEAVAAAAADEGDT